ncbi:MAG: hypothetical protein VX990_07685 [Pseudomonadota bacterium]|nr:hypothetical protein [Pseudomonadota bacterium]
MGAKYMAAFAVSGILTVATGSAWAGAAGSQNATQQQLKSFGTDMIPPEQLRTSQPQPVEPPSSVSMVGRSEIPGPYLHVDNVFGLANNLDGSQSASSSAAEKTDNFGLIGDSAGYRLSHNLLSDVTFSLRTEADVESGSAEGNRNESEIDALTVMFNSYINLANLGMITPYIGAGYTSLSTGMQTTFEGNTSESGAVANNPAYSVMGGTAITINDRASLNIGLLMHEIKAGLRFQF